MRNKISKFINLQGKYLTSLLFALLLGIGQMWGAETASWDFESNATGLTISDAGSASTARAKYSDTGSSWSNAAGTYCIYANLGSTKGSSTTITTSSSYSNISAISLMLGSSDRGKTEFALQVSSKADFSSDVTNVQARVTIKDNIATMTSNTTMYTLSYSISTPVSGYVRITLAQASGSNNKKLCVDNLSITYTDGDLDTYTVNYKDDANNDLGSETVEVGSKPTATSINKNKDFYTFEAWQLSGVDKSLTDDSWKSVAKDASVTLTARYSGPNYASTLDFAAVTVAGTTASNPIGTFLASGNMIGSNLGSSAWETSTSKSGFIGYKLKNKSAVIKFLVKAGKKVVITFGNVGADVTLSKGGVNTTIPTAAGDDAETVVPAFIPAADMEVTITTSSGSSSTVTLKKIEILSTYTATRVDDKSDGAGTDANVLETTLPTPTAISGWTFTGWVASEDVKLAEETKTAGTVLGAGTYTLLANTTFTAQWAEASATYDITYVSDHGTAPAAGNAASVVLAELSESGWAHKGWTANVDVTVDAATVEAGTLIANGKTAILASNVTFTAVWKEIFTVTFNSKDGSAVAPIDVEDGATLAAAPSAPTKNNYVFQGWSETDGGPVVADITAITISADKTFYAIWALDVQVTEIVFSNSFKGWIVGSAVTVYYLEGESAPTIASYAGKNLKAEGGVVISGDKIIATATDDSELEFDLTMTEVTPLAATGAQTFDGTEGYIKTRHAWTAERKWKMSKHDTDGRVARGETSLYIFLGAAESVTLDWGAQKVTEDVAVYVNGTFVKNVGKNNNSAIELSNGNNMVALYSLQTSGDIWLNGLTVAPWVPVTAVVLKEGTTAISEKEIWAGTNFTLTAEVTPDNASNKTITWTSSNTEVATVVDGVVTGVAASATPAIITATTVDGVYATCTVTVTAAPTPSADPVITAQPASANYYEGATIAALEVVATGESLTYQWYLGSDPIDGATNATYTPTVTAIGSYVYHCVVTNTEAGHLPTSLASSDATITIAEDPAAIKLLDGEGEINTTNFITGVSKGTVTISEVSHKCASFGSTGGSIVGLTGLNKVVAYNATTTQTKVKFILYNENSSPKEMYLQKVLEGATEVVTETIAVPSKEYHETQYYEYNSSDLRSFYVTVNSTNIKILQVKVIDNGTALKRAGEAGYELNLNLGRVFGAQSTATVFEGLAFEPSSNAKVLNSTELPIVKPLSFTIASPLTLAVTTSTAKYYVSQNAEEDGTTATAITAAGTEEFDLTAIGTWYIVPSTSSAVKLTNIAFAAPKCAEPAFNALANSEICEGDAYVALDGTATVADAGVPTYQWYNAANDEAIDGATAAEFTPTADGSYYVIATNHLADHSDNAKQSATVTVTTFASAQITSAPADVRQTVGENATLTVEASGKAPLSYQWYTCDDAEGNNPDIIAGAEAATYEVTVTAGLNQYYKVVVTSGCGEASAVALVEEWVALPQLSVSATTTWDWTNAGENIKLTGETTPKKNEECVMANVKVGNKMPTNDNTFNSQALLFYGENVRAKDGGRYYASLGHIKFNAAVSGKVTVEFSDNGTNNRKLKINDALSESSESKTDIKTFSAVVPAGEVTLMGVNSDGTESNQYIRISKIIFSTTDVDGADYTRNVTNGLYGTICLPNGGVMVGATLFEVAYYGGTSEKIFFDEVLDGVMEAGVPYIFLPREGASQLGVYFTDSEDASAGHKNGLYGTLTEMKTSNGTMPYDGTISILYNNMYVCVNSNNCTLPANRAYLKVGEITPIEPALAPGRRRISIGGVQSPTGLDAINADAEQAQKMLIDGKIYIIRGGHVYDAAGQLVK